MTTELSATEIVTEPVRLAFPHLWTPQAIDPLKPADKKYQAALLLPPDTDLQPFAKCLKVAMVEKWGPDFELRPGKNPIKRCDDRDPDKPLAGYEPGWFFINTSSKFQPSVLDQKKQEILDERRVFGGCWCRFHLNAYAWTHPTGGRGVSFGLNSVMLIREDARLGGRKDAREVFGEIEVKDFEGGGADGAATGDKLDDLLR